MCWKSKNKLEFTKDVNVTGMHDNNTLPESTNIDSSVNFIFFVVVIVMLLIVASCGLMFFKACRYEAKYSNLYDEWRKKQELIYSEVIPKDSVLSEIIAIDENQRPKGENTKADVQITKKEVGKYLIPLSEVLKIRESQKLLFVRQDQLTDDIRQETNNIINKTNGWLGFWMGVMAILGVFVPIALQFKLYRENRDNDAKLIQRCYRELDYLRKYEEKFEIAQKTAKAEIREELSKINTEIDRRFIGMQNDYINKMQSLKITATIRCLYNIMESPGIRTNELRNQFIERNWNEIATNVRYFIKYYSNQTTNDIDRHNMSIILVQVASVLESLMILIPRRNRQLESIVMESYDIIQELNSISLNNEAIICRLSNYQENLLNFHPIIILNG